MIKLLSVAIVAALFLESHQRVPGPEDPLYPKGPEEPEEPEMCFTNWFDRDDPSGTGDWELLKDLRKENPGQICENSLYMEAVSTDTTTSVISTRQTFYIFSLTQGLVCRNKDQSEGMCRDYKVRFWCPCRN
ncbi:hypothetical protein KUCAC02_019575 [Chaenocephalus aceratus]|uniref:Uncharacterized protein n=1 Tax=Chaenocephalus aceratus TaxID=36190 RepID=A0ACB9VQ85_CHAAC|nr:hypothetical protein KUCAC02_019575 [Chaenocephalus aceratus]